jgi:dCTP deaminase
MMLSDGDLQAAMDSGCLVVNPPGVMQPASIDLSLGDTFRYFEKDQPLGCIWPEHGAVSHEYVVPKDEAFPLKPGQFALASTVETIWLCDEYAAQVEGRSSMARLGLMVHITAGFIDPGFRGQITLELLNVNNTEILLTPGCRIAQLCVFELKSPARKPYGSEGLGSRYQGQQGPTASRSWMG